MRDAENDPQIELYSFHNGRMLSTEQLKTDIKELYRLKKVSKNGFEEVIASQERIIDALLAKIDFLQADRNALILQNHTLTQKVASQQCVIDLRRNLALPQPLFEFFSDLFTTKDLYQETNKLVFSKVSEIKSVRLSAAGNSGLALSCQASEAGVVRAFYLNALADHKLLQQLILLTNELKDDNTVTLHEQYPSNQPFALLLLEFFDEVRRGQFPSQFDLLQHLHTHVLLDQLILKALKARIEFAGTSVEVLLNALCNEFELRMEVVEAQSSKEYLFFVKQEEELLSQFDQQALFTLKHINNGGIVFPFRVASAQPSYLYSQASDSHREPLKDIDLYKSKLREEISSSNYIMRMVRSASSNLSEVY